MLLKIYAAIFDLENEDPAIILEHLPHGALANTCASGSL